MDDSAKRIKSFAQAFSKACRVQRQRLWSLSADSETPPPSQTQERVNLIAKQSKRGNPNEGFPLKTERHERFLWWSSVRQAYEFASKLTPTPPAKGILSLWNPIFARMIV